MKAWEWQDGAFAPCNGLPLSDRGFRYGMSLFESLRVAQGAPEFFDAHIIRLLTACAERGFVVKESRLRGVEALLSGASGFARIYVTAGDGAPAAPATQPRIYVLLEDRTPADPENPWEVTIHDDPVRPLFGGLKTGNYWAHVTAFTEAQARNYDEALLFNDFGELVSAAFANVFLVHNERIMTPPRFSGCRAGVIREWVIARRKVEERRLRREDVLSADEIFLTNSWIGVQPVATVEGRPLGRRYFGPTLAAEIARRSTTPPAEG